MTNTTNKCTVSRTATPNKINNIQNQLMKNIQAVESRLKKAYEYQGFINFNEHLIYLDQFYEIIDIQPPKREGEESIRFNFGLEKFIKDQWYLQYKQNLSCIFKSLLNQILS